MGFYGFACTVSGTIIPVTFIVLIANKTTQVESSVKSTSQLTQLGRQLLVGRYLRCWPFLCIYIIYIHISPIK